MLWNLIRSFQGMRLMGELEHCQLGRALWAMPVVCWPWQCVAHLHNQTDKPGLAGGQQRDKSEDPTYTTWQWCANPCTQARLSWQQPLLGSPHSFTPFMSYNVLHKLGQLLCVFVCFKYYCCPVPLQKVQLRGMSKGMSIQISSLGRFWFVEARVERGKKRI